MPLIKVPFKPGVNREIPEYANEGGYDFSNLIRFRMGYAEKIGGWANTNYVANPTSPGSYTYNGVTRSLTNWITLDGGNLLGFGTTQQYYVQNGVGSAYNDISPAANTASLLGTSFRTVAMGSPVVEIFNAASSFVAPTSANGGLDVGSVVYFYSQLSGGLLTEAGLYIDQESYPGTGSSVGYKILVGSSVSALTVNGVTLNASYPQSSTLSTPYVVTSVNRKTLTSVTASGSGTVATLIGIAADSTLPVAVGSTVYVYGLSVSGYNGAQIVQSASYNSSTGVTTITFNSTVTAAASGGTVTWIDSFQVIGSGTASAAGTDSTIASLAVTATYLPNVGDNTTIYSSSGAQSYTKRIWSQASFGDDLVFAIQGNPIYYWAKDTTNWNAATTLAAYANTKQYQQVNVTGTVTSSLTFAVDFNDYVFPGQTISKASGASGITAGTKIVSVSGLTVTVDIAVSITAGEVLNLSYSGQFVPTQTNKLYISPVYQFVIALGANPYDPTNANTTFDPLLVRWSDQANPYQWIPQSSNQAGEQSLGNGSKLVTAVANLQIILLFTDSAVYQMQYVGAPYVFSFTMLQDNISIISQNAAITANNVTWWMGVDKFYAFSGSVQVIPCPIRRFVFSNLNKQYAWQTVAGYNEGFSEIWWFYTSNNSTVNDSYVKYNFADQAWDYGFLNRTAWLGVGTQPYPVAALNVQATYLYNSIGSSDTTITVADTTSFPSSGVLLIGTESIPYTDKTSTTFKGCTRSSGVTHTAYSPVTLLTPNQLVYHEYFVDDHTVPGVTLPVPSYLQSSDFGLMQADADTAAGNSLFIMNRIIPDLTFTNSTASGGVVTFTLYPRLNPGSAYLTNVDSPTITSVLIPPGEQAVPPEQYVGQPTSRALATAGQGQIYTRVRGRTISLKVETGDSATKVSVSGYPLTINANSIGTMWQLGLLRFDVRKDGRR